MQKIIVLGAGMVGRAMAEELAQEYNVTSVDILDENLNRLPETITKVKAENIELTSVTSVKRNL